MTARHQATLTYIQNYVDSNGFAPSVRELCQHFGLKSSSSGQHRLQSLVDEGFIERAGPRAIRFL